MKKYSVVALLICITLWLTLFQWISFNPILNGTILFLNLVNSLIYRELLISYQFKQNIQPTSNVVFFYSHNYETVPKFGDLSQYITDIYCKRHNYAWVSFNHDTLVNVSPYWLRVQDLMKLSAAYPEDTIFVYLDLDTCINLKRVDMSIDHLLLNLTSDIKYDVYIGKDSSIASVINTGVILLRNTTWSRALLQEWWKRYNPNQWELKNGNWTCLVDAKTKCSWAGDAYEQGSLERIYTENWNDSTSHIGVLHMDLVSNHLREQKNTFIYHLMGASDNTRLRFFESQIKKYA
jgi:hypothetical protein